MASDLKEQTLESELKFNGRLLNLRVETVRLPDGTITNREIIQHPGAAGIVPVLADDRVILIRQFRKPTEEHLLEIPAGTLEPNETPDHCARRELAEETGYNAVNMQKLSAFYVAPGYSSELIHIFIATDLSPRGKNLDADEFLDVIKLPLQEAIALIDSGNIKDAKTIAALLITHRMQTHNKPEA